VQAEKSSFDLSFKGPNLNAEQKAEFERTCDGTFGDVELEIISFDNTFKVSGGVGIGLLAASGSLEAEVDFALEAEFKVTDYGVHAKLAYSVESSATYAWSYGGSGSIFGYDWNVGDNGGGDLGDAANEKEHIIKEQFFRFPG